MLAQAEHRGIFKILRNSKKNIAEQSFIDQKTGKIIIFYIIVKFFQNF